jgi:hypothetical protein
MKKGRKNLKTYFAGKDCKCHAYDAGECGCPSDWTPKETYQLRYELEDLKSLCKEFLDILNTVEVSDSEREFHPTRINSCRVHDAIRINKILAHICRIVTDSNKNTQ